MRIGLFLAYWPWLSFEEQVELARQADERGARLGLGRRRHGARTRPRCSGTSAAVTERIGLGSGLFQIPARSPAMTAMSAATLDAMSGGRFRLGLGVSGPQVSEGWHGVPFARPLSRTREYVEIVRAILRARGRCEYEGEEFELPVDGRTGLGKPLKLLAARPAARSRSTSARSGPKAVEQAGEIADGWMPFLLHSRAEPSSLPCAPGAATSTSRRWCWCACDDDIARGAQHGAPVARHLPRRDGSQGEELLRRDRRASAATGTRPRVPGAVPGGRPGRAPPPLSRRADRLGTAICHHAGRPGRTARRLRARSAPTPCCACRSATARASSRPSLPPPRRRGLATRCCPTGSRPRSRRADATRSRRRP